MPGPQRRERLPQRRPVERAVPLQGDGHVAEKASSSSQLRKQSMRRSPAYATRSAGDGARRKTRGGTSGGGGARPAAGPRSADDRRVRDGRPVDRAGGRAGQSLTVASGVRRGARHGGVGDASDPAGQIGARLHDGLGLDAGERPVLAREHGPQRLVPRADLAKGCLNNLGLRRAREPQRHRQVGHRALRVELTHEPQASPCGRHRELLSRGTGPVKSRRARETRCAAGPETLIGRIPARTTRPVPVGRQDRAASRLTNSC